MPKVEETAAAVAVEIVEGIGGAAIQGPGLALGDSKDLEVVGTALKFPIFLLPVLGRYVLPKQFYCSLLTRFSGFKRLFSR